MFSYTQPLYRQYYHWTVWGYKINHWKGIWRGQLLRHLQFYLHFFCSKVIRWITFFLWLLKEPGAWYRRSIIPLPYPILGMSWCFEKQRLSEGVCSFEDRLMTSTRATERSINHRVPWLDDDVTLCHFIWPCQRINFVLGGYFYYRFCLIITSDWCVN